MKKASEAQIKDFENPLISITDAAAMLRKKIPKNDKPYDQAVKKCNNALVDEWFNRLLKKLCNTEGKMLSNNVYPSWILFAEGKEIISSRKFKDHLPQASKEYCDFWLDIIKTKTVAELHELGVTTVAKGWECMVNFLRYTSTEEKWNTVYSKSEDPYEWYKLAIKFPEIFKPTHPFFFGLTNDEFADLRDKVFTLVNTKVEPDN